MRGRADYSINWEETVDAIHRSIAAEKTVSTRLKRIADTFLGRPYFSDSLVGGPDHRERLVVDLEAFDCITFIEIALALARSRSKKGFLAELEKKASSPSSRRHVTGTAGSSGLPATITSPTG
jgi:hypothetical protein